MPVQRAGDSKEAQAAPEVPPSSTDDLAPNAPPKKQAVSDKKADQSVMALVTCITTQANATGVFILCVASALAGSGYRTELICPMTSYLRVFANLASPVLYRSNHAWCASLSCPCSQSYLVQVQRLLRRRGRDLALLLRHLAKVDGHQHWYPMCSANSLCHSACLVQIPCRSY